MARLKVAVLISGRGSNLQALMTACADPAFPAEIVQVISNRPEAAGLSRAREAGIPAAVIDHRDYASREEFDAAIDAALTRVSAGLVCLAGFMRLFSAGFVNAWRDKIINIHPSLLPAFPGRNTHERVLAAGALVTGCTVHFVRPEMDRGPVILQAAVSVEPGDTPESLAARVLKAEHRIYPEAVRLIAEGRVQVMGEAVTIDGAPAPKVLPADPNG